jgi:phage terminase small subunit
MLNERQLRFARAYTLEANATKAAIAAGYSKKTAYSQGQRLLKNVEVKGWIESKLAEQAEKYEVTLDRITRELALVAFANMQDYTTVVEAGKHLDLDLSDLTRDQFAAIQEIAVDTTGGTGDGKRRRVLRTRFKLGSKVQALEQLGRSLQMFTDRVELGLGDSIVERLHAGRKRAAGR